MPSAQLVLPVARSNGASGHRHTPEPIGAEGQAAEDAVVAPMVGVQVWVRRITIWAVLAVAAVAAIASYESPYVKRWVG